VTLTRGQVQRHVGAKRQCKILKKLVKNLMLIFMSGFGFWHILDSEFYIVLTVFSLSSNMGIKV
jgi:hypothetical protein